jgi:proteasome lid subunit RPN8/RPN11
MQATCSSQLNVPLPAFAWSCAQKTQTWKCGTLSCPDGVAQVDFHQGEALLQVALACFHSHPGRLALLSSSHR